jgi:lipoprotein-releasing system permease protein
MDGFQTEIKEKIIDNNSHIVIFSRFRNYFPHYKTIVGRLEKIKDQFTEIDPFFQGQVLVRKQDEIAGVLIKGVIPRFQGRPHGLAKHLTHTINQKKAIPLHKNKRQVVLSQSIAGRLGVTVGDYVDIVSPYGGQLKISGFAPTMTKFRVSALYRTGYGPIDSNQIYTSLTQAQRLFRKGNVVWGIGIKGHNAYQAHRLRQIVEKQLTNRYYVLTWSEQQKSFFNALRMEKLILRIFLTLIILIAAFNIISTLIMMIMEKKKDIGVLLAVGLSKRRIINIFIFNGLFIGIFGTIIGVVSGITSVLYLNQILNIIETKINQGIDLVGGLIRHFDPAFPKLQHITLYSNKVYGILEIPVKIDEWNIVITAVMGIVLCLLASIYPAFKAASLNPIEAINEQ